MCPCLLQTSRFSIPESHLPISGSPLWSAGFPLGFYPSRCHVGESPSLPGNSYSPFSRRLACSSLLSRPPPFTSAGGSSLCPVTRLPYQLGEVLPSSFTGSDLLGRGSGLPSLNRPPCGPPDRVPHPFGLPPSCFSLSSCSPLAAVSGAPCQSHGLVCRLSLPFASSPDLFSLPLPSPLGLPRPPDPVVSGDQSLLFGVDVSRVSSCGEILCSPSSLVHPDHGRVQLRSGRFSSPTSSFRTVVSSGPSPSYQPTGTEGCFLGSPRFPSPSDGSFGPGQVRQFNSGCLHKPPGRYSFDSSLSRDSSTPYLGRQERIVLSASHIPGQQNLVADFLSRGKFLPSEWSLHPSVFLQILHVYPPLSVDLFASSLAHLLTCYCARADDPDAWALDAFSIPVSDFLGFAFPPFALLPRVLEKVASDRASLLLVAPFWPKRPWFPRLLSLLAGQPRSLPVFPGLLRQPVSLIQHPNPRVLHLTLWPLSAQPGVRQAFLSGLPTLQPYISDPRLDQLMIPDSGYSSNGVPLIRLTHIMPL